jgi:hypothetical protein
VRRRVRPQVRIDVRAVGNPARLVTLEDPNAPPTMAQDAFARLRPPEGTTPEAVASWRLVVEKVARAVRVVPAPQAALVPQASERSDTSACGSIRQEAEALAVETGSDAVVALTADLLDEVGA